MKAAEIFRLRRGFLASLLVAALATTALLSHPITAQAVSATDFKPGNIISDADFYNGGALTPSGVQGFLNEKVSRCTIGDPGLAPGTAWGGTQIAAKCARDFTMTTVSKASNPYCAAYGGAANESAAQIIAKVGQACGISQKVLLVMLEKEQSLVTDTWPTVRQFNVAMGYACPDSGPGNSANCDSTYSGFFNQVYRAAWQLKVYKANPASYNYRPYQTNTIQWHPNTGCGTSPVYIDNSATAALYIYTPYRPNQAALNAGWGTGDSCSTYGNRNFFLFYSTWFIASPVVYPKIDAVYASNTWLGVAATGYNSNSSNGGGVVRGFQNGVITLQNGASSAFILSGEIRRSYTANALGLGGPLGWPISGASCVTSTNCVQDFQWGRIRTSANGTSIEVAAIALVSSVEQASLGPIVSTPSGQRGNGGGFVQGHANGAVTWNRDVGAFSLQGKIRTVFGEFGGTSGSLGWPSSTSNYFEANGGANVQGFQNAAITSSSAGTFVLSGEMRSGFGKYGGTAGSLGWPASNANAISSSGGGKVQAFENGALTLRNGSNEAVLLSGDYRRIFNESGGFSGIPGWPIGEATRFETSGGGHVQGFQNAAITSSPAGTYILSGLMRTAFGSQGGLGGELGWPASNLSTLAAAGGGKIQSFQHGILAQKNDMPAPIKLLGDNLRVFDEAGGISGLPGWPTSESNYFSGNGGGYVQGFQNSAITTSPSGTFMLSGTMRTAFAARGGLSGEPGWPASDMACDVDSCEQQFQNGTLKIDVKTQAHTFESN